MGGDGSRRRGSRLAMAGAPEREPGRRQARNAPPLHRGAALSRPGEDDHPVKPPTARRQDERKPALTFGMARTLSQTSASARLGGQPLRCRCRVGMILLQACGALVLALRLEQLALRLVELAERVVRLGETRIRLGCRLE